MDNQKEQIGAIEAARLIGITVERLYYWERKGILTPAFEQHGERQFRRYPPCDVEAAKQVKEWMEREDLTLQGAIKRLKNGHSVKEMEAK